MHILYFMVFSIGIFNYLRRGMAKINVHYKFSKLNKEKKKQIIILLPNYNQQLIDNKPYVINDDYNTKIAFTGKKTSFHQYLT